MDDNGNEYAVDDYEYAVHPHDGDDLDDGLDYGFHIVSVDEMSGYQDDLETD